MQWLLTFILPIGFISFYPVSEFIGKANAMVLPGELSIMTPVIGCLLFILANSMFNYGLKKYESVGS